MSANRISLYSLLGRARNTTPREPLPPLTRRIFLLSFMSEFLVIYPFYVIMFGERGNVSPAGVGILLASWMVLSVVSEVPTGVIADKMSKKWSLVLGRILPLLGLAVWLCAPNFVGYMIGFMIWGIGDAFTSGALQAYLYETLDDTNKKAFGKIYARTSAFSMLAYTAGGLAAFVIGPHYPLLLVLSMAVTAVSLGIALSLPDTHSKTEVEVEIKPKIIASAVKTIRGNRGLQRIFIGAVIIQGLMGMIAEYLPAYYQQVGTPTKVVALVIALGSASAVLLYWWMHHVEAQLARYQLLILLAFTGMFVLSFAGGVIVAVAMFFVFSRMLRVVSVNNETQLQHHARDESRATLGSLYSFAGKLLSAGLVAIVGFFAVNDKIVAPLRWSTLIMVGLFAVSWGYFWLRQRKLVS